MSTEVETQQPTVAPVQPVVVEEPAPAVENVATIATITTSNGDHKCEEKKNGAAKKEKEVEPPKDPKTETQEWLRQQHKAVVHKANYYVLNWFANEAYAEDDQAKPVLPKNENATRNEFINYFKDGVLLARIANKFQPGAAEAVKEGEEAKTKENQQANIGVFSSVAKQFVPEEQLFTHEDLEKGKESYPKVFSTVFHVMIASPAEHFKAAGGNFEQFRSEIDAVSTQKFWQKLINQFSNTGAYISAIVRRPFTRSNSNVQAEQQPEQNGVHANGTETVENVSSTVTQVEEKKEEAPVVAVN